MPSDNGYVVDKPWYVSADFIYYTDTFIHAPAYICNAIKIESLDLSDTYMNAVKH